MRDEEGWRAELERYVAGEARPVDKLDHMPRVHRAAREIARCGDIRYDDDVVHAAVWLHDLGVFIGHRPESIEALATWDHVAYAMRETPAILRRVGFPAEKIDAVIEAIRTHLAERAPTTIEGTLVRDADLLEQLGAVAVLRTVSKVGRDTRVPDHTAALRAIAAAAERIPPRIALAATRGLAAPRLAAMRSFIAAADAEGLAR